MSRLTAFISVLVAAFFVTMAPAPAGAENTDKLANLTFNVPVQIPGVMLDAGTYRFRLADEGRKVIQVTSHDGLRIYGAFHTMPVNRVEATDHPTVTFRETPAGVPPAVASFFYSGEHDGYEFMYPRGGPVMTAKVMPQPPITYTRIPVAVIPEPIATPEPAPLVTERVAETAVEPAREPVVEPAVEPPAAPAARLPETATPLPLFAFGGLASLVLGLGTGLLRRRLH